MRIKKIKLYGFMLNLSFLHLFLMNGLFALMNGCFVLIKN